MYLYEIDSGIVEFVQTIQNRATTVSLRSDGIIQTVTREVDRFKVEDYHDLIHSCLLLSSNKSFVHLVIVNSYLPYDNQVLEMSASHPYSKLSPAVGLVFKSVATKMVFNFYIRIFKPKYQVKAFSSSERAADWLRKFI
jgi:hypothetical protein